MGSNVVQNPQTEKAKQAVNRQPEKQPHGDGQQPDKKDHEYRRDK